MENNIRATITELMKINDIPRIRTKDVTYEGKIGQGGQAKVYKGTFNGEEVAIKIVLNPDLKCLAHEVVILASLRHENVAKFHGIILDDEKNICLVFQYIGSKCLESYKPDNLSDNNKLAILKQLASVLEYMHSQQCVHRDLKPENVMFNPDTNKLHLIDFGISKVVQDDSGIKTRAKGTPHYIAPESFIAANADDDNGEALVSVIGPGVDVWSYGCVVSWLYSGILPWTNKYKNKMEQIQMVLIMKKPFPIPNQISDKNIVTLVEMCVKVDEKKRAGMVDIKKYVNNL